eukprot:Opistho-2@41774
MGAGAAFGRRRRERKIAPTIVSFLTPRELQPAVTAVSLQRRGENIEVLLMKYRWQLALAMLNCTDMCDKKKLCVSLLHIFEFHNKLPDFLCFVVKNDLDTRTWRSFLNGATTSRELLFHFVGVCGNNFFVETSRFFVTDIVNSQLSSSAIDNDAFWELMRASCEKYLGEMLRVLATCPYYLRVIFRRLSRVFSAHDAPHPPHVIVSYIIFNFFYRPIIMNPNSHGLLRSTPSEKAQMILAFVGQFFALVGGGMVIKPPIVCREPFLSFINSNQERCFAAVKDLMVLPVLSLRELAARRVVQSGIDWKDIAIPEILKDDLTSLTYVRPSQKKFALFFVQSYFDEKAPQICDSLMQLCQRDNPSASFLKKGGWLGPPKLDAIRLQRLFFQHIDRPDMDKVAQQLTHYL